MPETMNFSDLDGYFADLNADGADWPEGRNVSQVQVGDDFSYSLGKHTLKAGISYKKNYVSDHNMTILSTPIVLTCGSAVTCVAAAGVSGSLFGQGISLEALQSFTTHP